MTWFGSSAVLLPLLCVGLTVHGEPPRAVSPFRAAVEFGMADVPGWQPDQTPADFLDGIGSRVKARWRQLYRDGPPPPSTVRPLSAFTLGGLVADSFLALQAADAHSDVIEVGVPFSDPLADGLVNQLAAQRGLASGTTSASGV